MTNEDLKYCPFCGHKIMSLLPRRRESSVVYWYVAGCGRCEIYTPEYPSIEKAVEAWNKRATDLIP